MRYRSGGLALAAVLLVLLAGCGQPGEQPGDEPLGVSEALADGGADVLVSGYLFADPGGTRLCEAIAESFPPQCGGASLVVEDVVLSEVGELDEEGDHRWSPEPVRLRGDISGDTLRVTDSSPDAALRSPAS